MLFRFKEGSVVVEGKHDAEALRKLGIASYTYECIMRGARPQQHNVFILTDADRRGLEKRERLLAVLSEEGYKADYRAGENMLSMLNSRCIEEIYSPAMQALDIEMYYHGKDLFRHSKVYGRG